MKNLNGKVVLITGGSAGIGKAIAERFAEEGSIIVIADVAAGAGEAVAESLGAHFCFTDVTQAASVEAAVAFTSRMHGRLDVMINNAGVESLQLPLHESKLEDWKRVIDVNLSGTFHGMKYALTQFIRQGVGGNIVNMSSVGGLVGFPNGTPYSASKGGISNMTRTAAIEYGKYGIRVNAVAPTAVLSGQGRRFIDASPDPEATLGFLKTMNPLAGIPSAEDVAACAAFLASDDASFISGVVLPVDGGYTAA